MTTSEPPGAPETESETGLLGGAPGPAGTGEATDAAADPEAPGGPDPQPQRENNKED